MGAYSRWTQEQTDLLLENYGILKDEILAKKLDRSASAIRARANHLHLIRSQNFLTASDVARIFGIDEGTLSVIWIPKGLLKAKKSTVGGGRNRRWRIEERDLEAFIKNHQDRYDPAKVNPELYPYWANLVKKYVPKNYTIKHGRTYSSWEDAFILNNRQKMTEKEIAQKLHRTKGSIHARAVLLRKQGRLLPYKKTWQLRFSNNTLLASRWKPDEDLFLRENWGRPLTPEELEQMSVNSLRWGTHFTAKDASKHLGRTFQSCWARASRLGLLNENWIKNKEQLAS